MQVVAIVATIPDFAAATAAAIISTNAI